MVSLSPLGANYVANATLFPQQINLAATFNEELARAMGRITAKVRACWVFLCKMKRWGEGVIGRASVYTYRLMIGLEPCTRFGSTHRTLRLQAPRRCLRRF